MEDEDEFLCGPRAMQWTPGRPRAVLESTPGRARPERDAVPPGALPGRPDGRCADTRGTKPIYI